MHAREIMTADPAVVTPDDPARRVAELMAEHDCGCLPVVDARQGGRVIGVVTDRDLALRGLAQGRGPETPVRELMTPDPECCRADDDVKDVERVMTDWQVRRVVVVDADRRCVGMIAQADLARKVGPREPAAVEHFGRPAAAVGRDDRQSLRQRFDEHVAESFPARREQQPPGEPHSVTSDNGVFASPFFGVGETFSRTFVETGTFPYHCIPHPHMRAVIIVQ